MLTETLLIARAAALDALAVLLPVDCAGCGTPDRGVCDDCRAALARDPILRGIGTPLLRVWAAGDYAGVRRRVILALKESGRTDVAGAMAPGLAAAVRAALAAQERPGTMGLCAIPSSRSGRRRRGYDPIRLVAARAGLPRLTSLRRTRAGSAQKVLGISGRAANAAGSMVAAASMDGRRVLLVDDVVTTGATLLEARRALQEAGAEVVGAVVLASTPRMHRAPSWRSADAPEAPGDTAGGEG